MAKDMKPSMAKNNSKTWVIAVVAVIVVLLLIVWAKRAYVAPAPEAVPAEQPAAPAPTPGQETVPTTPGAETTAPAAGEQAAGEKEKVLSAPGNAEILDT